MTPGWRGVMEEYRDLLDIGAGTPVVTLLEGGTPLVPAPRLSERVRAEVWLKVEGANPTGSFKDRGMTVAITKAMVASCATATRIVNRSVHNPCSKLASMIANSIANR